MKSLAAIRALFGAAALYDGLLGATFLVAHRALFDAYGVTPPNHPGYVQFPGALLIVFALMFLAVARRPAENRNLIPYGILLKVAYCGVVLRYWLGPGIPDMWKPFCLVDLLFLAAFAWAWSALRPAPAATAG